MDLFQQLRSDLNEKLVQFDLVLQQPDRCIENYFSELTTEIDLITETALDALPAGDVQRETINASREIIIAYIKQQQKELTQFVGMLGNGDIWKESRGVYERVDRDIKALSPEMVDLEDQYLKLALTILEQKSALEELVLGSDLPVLYKDLESDRNVLVSLNGVSFSHFDLNCFKEFLRRRPRSSSICERDLKEFNRLKQQLNEKHLLICCHKPFEIDAYMMLAEPFAQFINDVLESVPQQLIVQVKASLAEVALPSPLFYDDQNETRLSSGAAADIETLNLSINRLQKFGNEPTLPWADLRKIKLVSPSYPEAKLKIAFLNRLVELADVELSQPVTFVSGFSRAPTLAGLSVLWTTSASTRKKNLLHTFMEGSLMTRLFSDQFRELKLSDMKLGSSGHLNQLPGFLGRFAALVKSLDLGKNGLTSLPDGSFAELTSLESLDLSWNKLHSLPENFFNGLLHLKKLNLSGNAISDLRVGIFEHLNHLIDLDLSSNKLARISRSMINQLERIQNLKLGNNPIAQLDAGVFLGIKQLRVLDLSHCEIKSVEVDIFRTLKELVTLDLSNNQIDAIFFKADTAEESVPLNSTRLTDEQVASVKKNLFASSIDFSDCSLASLDSVSLSKRCPKLQSIMLSGNRLSVIQPEWFASLSNLKVLDLSRNGIESLPNPATFASCPALQHLKLNDNRISHIATDLFKGFYFLENIDLSNNRLSSIGGNELSCLSSLRSLSLSGNEITQFRVETVCRNMRHLNQLDLSNNQLDDCSINEATFKHLFLREKLQHLNLANNQLTSLAFVRHLTRLEELNVSYNNIEAIYDINGNHLFPNLVSLKHLNLSGNPCISRS